MLNTIKAWHNRMYSDNIVRANKSIKNRRKEGIRQYNIIFT